MASFEKRASGWRAQVYVKGTRDSQVFATKSQAIAWAAIRETELRNNIATRIVDGKTLDHACRRYEKEVSVHKRGHQWEVKRLNWMCELGLTQKK